MFVNQATADGIAKVQVDMIAKQIGDSGEIAILSAAANATNQNAWIAMMKKDLAANHPNIKLDAVVYGNDDDQTSFDKTSALLQQYPNLKGIISPTTVGIAAAARYLSKSDAKGKVALTGLGTPNQMRPFVKDGTVKEFALWNPEDLGYLAAYAASALVDGTITGARGRLVRRRIAGQVHRRLRRHRAPGQAVRLRQVEHRPVQLLIHPGRRPAVILRTAGRSPDHPMFHPSRPLGGESCACASSSR